MKGSGFPLEDCEPFLLGVGLICISRSVLFVPVQVCVRTLWPLPGLPYSGFLASPVPAPVPASPPTPLTRMIDWVSWPLGKNIDKWIIALLKGLAAVKKFSILIEVSLAKIEKVGGLCPNLGLWPFPLVSSGCSAGVGCRVLGPLCDGANSLLLSGPQIAAPYPDCSSQGMSAHPLLAQPWLPASPCLAPSSSEARLSVFLLLLSACCFQSTVSAVATLGFG